MCDVDCLKYCQKFVVYGTCPVGMLRRQNTVSTDMHLLEIFGMFLTRAVKCEHSSALNDADTFHFDLQHCV